MWYSIASVVNFLSQYYRRSDSWAAPCATSDYSFDACSIGRAMGSLHGTSRPFCFGVQRVKGIHRLVRSVQLATVARRGPATRFEILDGLRRPASNKGDTESSSLAPSVTVSARESTPKRVKRR